MRASTRRAGASLLLVVSLSLAGTAARGDELLVMPYACTMVGGRPLLTPAPEQSHRIIGQREQRAFTACSPANPDMCRNWTVHRFDVDCEGARVPWVSVVASVAEETTRRAWVESGRLMLRMSPAWSFEPGDPCARAPGFDDRFGFGRMRRYCADRRAMAPPPIVEMPFGFAPMLGIDGIFVKTPGPTSRPAAPAPPAVAAWPPAPPPKVTRAEPPPPPRADPAPPPAARLEPAPTDTAANKAPAKGTAPPHPEAAVQPPAKIAAAPPAPIAKASPPAPKESPPAAAPGEPVIPKIINRPEAATTDVTAQARTQTTAAKAAAKDPDAARPGANLPAASADVARTRPAPAPGPGPTHDSTPITVSLLSVVRGPTIGMIAFGGLALVLLAAFVLARRRERLAGAPPPRDIASVSLEGRRGRGPLVPHGPAAKPRQPPAAAPPPAPPVQAPAVQGTTAWVDRIPQTRAEALQMLGMGVSRDATEAAIKKIVDGLRLSWHPDLAKDDADRQLREFRVKQVNAAWDLLRGKRLERLDS